MPDVVKSLIDGFDKVTDILNVGRLLFYTTAGFCAVLPLAMCILLLGHDNVPYSYWVQFMSDLVKSSRQFAVWIASLIFGFIISVLANAMYQPKSVPEEQAIPQSYAFQYPRLYSGGVQRTGSTPKDYAAWLVSEYYRYFEIALFIPYGLLLSLPVYSLYSLAYLIRTTSHAKGFVLDTSYFAFPIWTFGSGLAWTVLWPDFWLPQVVQKTYEDWVRAKRNAIKGLEQFVKDTEPPVPKQPEASKAQS
ncbi:MAG: hypothetical protein LAO55_25965 [Acidobacteriia bacterium]|nr:hypothetical protein [Terriglobia bacterium]